MKKEGEVSKAFSSKQRRLIIILSAGVLLGLAVWLVTSALRDNIVLFFTPSELTLEHKQVKRLRIGGLIAENSVQIDGLNAKFSITDETAQIDVFYEGALPDLFREGQGIIAEGQFQQEIFVADTVLAKHDENYMPREIAESLKEQGVWQGGDE